MTIRYVFPNMIYTEKYQFNDRFSITNMKTYKLYGETFIHLLYISHLEELHSETIIGKLMKSYNLNIVKIPFKFTIVRHTGYFSL